MVKFPDRSKIDPKYAISEETLDEVLEEDLEFEKMGKKMRRGAALGGAAGAGLSAVAITALDKAMEEKYGSGLSPHQKRRDIFHKEITGEPRGPRDIGDPKMPSKALGTAAGAMIGAAAGYGVPAVKEILQEKARERKERRQDRKADRMERDFYAEMDALRKAAQNEE
tara:strand:+ start:294 stop:797 length:504 start_codon:yes stop_codon:yes gene_type:complete